MVWVLAFDRLTVKAKAVVPGGVLLVVPSGWATSLMESAGWVSSFWMVPVPTALAIVALVAPDRVTVKVSSGSNAVSAHTSTVTGLLVSPGAKVIFFNDTATTEIYPLSLHDALPISIAVTLPVA